jgi:hypothetical protein
MKKFISGLIVGICVSAVSSVFAASPLQSISALLNNNLIIKIDGKEANLSDPIITYNNKTYLPLRDIANILNLNTNYSSGVVEITKKTEPVQSSISDNKIYVNGRVLVNLLSEKYPNIEIGLSEYGKLTFGDKAYQLQKDNVNLTFSVQVLIEEGIVTEADFK